MLNRGVLIVTPAQPYIAWASSLDDSGIVPAVDDEKTIYLVPSFEDDAEAERVLNLVYAEVFESEVLLSLVFAMLGGAYMHRAKGVPEGQALLIAALLFAPMLVWSVRLVEVRLKFPKASA